MSRAVETAVLGAGVSGLAYAHARGPDADLVVLEASAQAGGLVRTLRASLPGERGADSSGEIRCELGPEALAQLNDDTRALLDELRLEALDLPLATKKRFLVRRGKLHEVPTAPLDALKSPLLSAGGKMRALSEKWRDPGRALDGSIADFVRHRLGSEVLETFVDPLISGIHAGDPEELSLRACFPEVAHLVEQHGSLLAALSARRPAVGVPARPAVVKLAGGMDQLPRALAARLGARLRLASAVHDLERRGERWLVLCGSESFEARRVVVALPAPAARTLLARACPDAARELESLRCESLVSLASVFERGQVEHPLDGFGYLVPSREGQAQLGTLFPSSIDPSSCPAGHVLLRTMLGGARRPELVRASDRELLALVEREAGPLLGLRGAPAWFHVERHADALPRYDLDHPRRVRALEQAVARTPGVTVLGNYLRGLGLPALIAAARALAREHAAASTTE